MKWVLYDFKSAREPWFDEAEQIYIKKINHFSAFEVVHLKTMKADREEADLKIKFESKQLLEKITSDDFVILLDEKGKKLTSLEFAKVISTIAESGKKRGVFIIGGAFGASAQVKEMAQKTVCLSDLTMNHLVAEVVLLEQFYRALTIINRIPYHNQ